MGKNSNLSSSKKQRLEREKAEAEALEKQKKQNRILLFTFCGILALALIGLGIGIGVSAIKNKKRQENMVEGAIVDPVNTSYTSSSEITDLVRLTVRYTDENDVYRQGEIIVKLNASVAPITVANFQKLVSEKFYDGLTFHRIYAGFMIQGGDPDGNGTGGSDETIKGEFSANGVQNSLSHKRGVISMARSSVSYDSASSQFFIMHAANTGLDGQYAAFGEVVSGMDTVDGIAGTEVKYNSSGEKSSPVNPVTIVSAEFVTQAG